MKQFGVVVSLALFFSTASGVYAAPIGVDGVKGAEWAGVTATHVL